MLPKISIVIPSLNKVEYIEETLRSIVDQDYPNLEIIIRDGGSTDGTLKIIKKYAKKYPKVIFWEVREDNGQTDAINKGFKKTKGEILTYINADDVYEDGALRKVGEYFATHPKTLWLAGRGRVIDTDGREIAKPVTWYKNLFLSLNLNSSLLIFNYLMQPSVFISSQAYLKYGPFSGTKSGVMEYDLWLRLGNIQMPKVIDETLTSFRLTEGNLSATNFEAILYEDNKIAKKYTKDPIILFLHWLHNVGRVITLYTSRI